ncbi:MAG: IclR family transcriptional regulator domain-containing protein [Phreatobacter sp.]
MSDGDARQSQTFVTGFARGLSVIEAFGPGHRSMSVAEVAQRIKLDRAVTRRLLLTLTELGFAKVNGKQFELTTRVLRLGYSFLASVGLGAALQPYLDELSRTIEETVSISVLDEAEVIFVARSDMPGRRMAFVVTMGMRLPAFTAASGRVLLAALPPGEVEALLARTKVEKLMPNTITARGELLKIVAAAGANGYAINREELEEGLIGISVPVRNRAGLIVASLNASASALRTSEERLLNEILPRLKEGATRMSAMLP